MMRSRQAWGAKRWVCTAAIAVATLAAATVSVAVSYAAVSQTQAPALALQLWPSSDAKADLAAQLMASPDLDGSYARAQRLARSALLRQPMSVRAASTLALLAGYANRPVQAERLLAYAETLSRRDLPTQLALIEIQVQANNVRKALIHYDRALRTSQDAEAILIPVLVAASNNLDVALPLAPMLAARSDWWKSFTLQMIQQDTAAPSSYVLLHALHLDIGRTDEHAMAEDAIHRMAGHGRVDLAARLYAELRPDRPRPAAQVHDGDFRHIGGLAPFDWELTNTANLSASVEARPDGKGNGLFLQATNGTSGLAARQLLVPPPGAYVLRFDIGGLTSSGGQVTAIARCNSSGTPLAFARPDPATDEAIRPVTLRVAVPASCRGLWIEFSIQASDGTDTPPPWIGAVAFQPAR